MNIGPPTPGANRRLPGRPLQQIVARACAGCRALLLAGLLLPALPVAHAEAATADDLMGMSLEALMNIEVTSVARRPQKKSEAAAAIFVITADDLRRWGVTSVPDALRRVPGIQVARIDANKWAITARGFNSRFANKLLVLIDGRSVYTPLFAGVYWEANQVMLEDIERIEVIRGPGGTLWGDNAVNGVINIITRSAADTQGTLVAIGAGNEERGSGAVRYGGATADGKYYRVYGKFRSVDSGEPVDSGAVAHDDGALGQGGFRLDWGHGPADSYTLQGDASRVRAGQELMMATAPAPLVEDAEYNGSNLLYRWTHRHSTRSDYALQIYLDHVGLSSAVLFEDRDTLDLDFQHHIRANAIHDIMWGLNFRAVHDNTDPTQIFRLQPPDRTTRLYAAFLQDEMALLDDRAHLTLGSKFEHNDFTGFEAQPNLRLTWLTHSGDTVWGAVSRAVRTPARGEQDVVLDVIPPSPAPSPLTIYGNDHYRSEVLVAWELGYRLAVAKQLSLDFTAFYNDYHKLRTVDIYSVAPPLEARFGNNLAGNSRGVEIDALWQVSDSLSFHANYSYLRISLNLQNGSTDAQSQDAEHASPSGMANLWMTADLGKRTQLDVCLRHVGSIRTPGTMTDIHAYTALDVSMAWKPRKGLELSLSGQNLLDSSHPEFNPDFIYSFPTEVQRSVYGKITLKY
jgi:iron complex outermembrane receptor protein